jgi:hypothetical protein
MDAELPIRTIAMTIQPKLSRCATRALLILLLIVPTLSAGEQKDEADAAEPHLTLPPGMYKLHPRPSSTPELSAEQRAEIERLEALGYVAGTIPAGPTDGVTIHDAERTASGLNFFTSGHAPDAILMDMDGTILHRWQIPSLEIWPEAQKRENLNYLRRAHLFESGDILAIFEGVGLVKLDADSKVLWSSAPGAHHDLDVADNGDIYVLTHHARIIPALDEKRPVLEDFIVILDANGVEKRRISLITAFTESRFKPQLGHRWGDVLHTNTVHILDGSLAEKQPAFAAGNILISIKKLSRLAVLDMSTEKIAWSKQGTYRRQHDAQILPNGNLLLFDNWLHGLKSSRALELDPSNMERRWAYAGTQSEPLFSSWCGTVQRLSNGNTLIVESVEGRVIEVTTDGEIVWEYRNPHRFGPYVALIFDLDRLKPDFPLDWVSKSKALASKSKNRVSISKDQASDSPAPK